MNGRSATIGDLFPEARGGPSAGVTASRLASDSRKVTPGSVFVAVPGSKADGGAFIPQAVAAGAVAIVGESARPAGLDERVAYVTVPDVRRSLALAAARLHPRQPGTVVAVTGTSGKSSVADFARQLFAALGHPAASVGTLGVLTSGGAAYGSLTTPDPLTLHETLDRLAGEGITHLAMEASSHGLDQRRLDGVRLKAGGYTNLGHDHLDYHETMDSYRQAKLRLFETLLPDDAAAVVNADGALAALFLEDGGRPRPARPEHGPGRRHAEAGGCGARRLRPAPVGPVPAGGRPGPAVRRGASPRRRLPGGKRPLGGRAGARRGG